jgi:hypothetical protein
MVGAVTYGFHRGSRSEILADYLFSSFGTVTPVRVHDDYGVDLFCTLTEMDGPLWRVNKYYSVQVKSSEDPWVFDSKPAIRWLMDHPTPLFLACVKKNLGELFVYQTIPRFFGDFPYATDVVKLVPSMDEESVFGSWAGGDEISLSAPILRATLEDLTNKQRLVELQKVMQYWVETDDYNCMLHKMGLLRVRGPYKYRVNEVPPGGLVEQGNTRPSPQQLAKAILSVVEAVDCAGHQLLASGDRTAALHGAMLLNHLRKAFPGVFEKDLRWQPDRPWTLESAILPPLQHALSPDRNPSYWTELLDRLIESVMNLPDVARFIADIEPKQSGSSSTPPPG